MDLFLIRHGAVESAADGAFYGGTEVALSPLGRAEAGGAAAFLDGISMHQVYSSPLSRACYGAEQLLNGRSLERARVVHGLREIDRGRWVGLRPAEVAARWPQDLSSHRADLESWCGHRGESLGQLRDRVLRSLGQVLEHHAGEAVGVVSHLFPTRAVLAAAQGLGLDAWAGLEVPTGSVSWLRFPKDAFKPRLNWSRAEVRLIGHQPELVPFSELFPHAFPARA